MLKSFIHKVHKLEEIHEHIMKAFEIICQARSNSKFNTNKFSSELRYLMELEKQNDTDLLMTPLKTIYDYVKSDKAVKQILKEGIINNNKIEQLCNDSSVDPVLYKELPEPLAKVLKSFFNNLYEKFLNRAHVKAKYLGLKNHFDSLIINSDLQVCPFCGINDLQSQYDDGRDAYDHYLPKGTFPFSSINFNNLFPMCYECNSKHKLEKSMIYDDLRGNDKTKRRKAYYPFGNNTASVAIKFEVNKAEPFPADLKKLAPKNLSVKLAGVDNEKVVSWDRTFRISKRYKAKSCQFLKVWLETLLEEYRRSAQMLKGKYGIDINWDDFLDTQLSISENELFKDKNLIRVALFKMLRDECDLKNHLQTWSNTHYS